MNSTPIDLALRHISETRSMLELLITSSESFDYPKAKEALEALTRKLRDLRKVQAQLQAGARSAAADIRPVIFQAALPPRAPLG